MNLNEPLLREKRKIREGGLNGDAYMETNQPLFYRKLNYNLFQHGLYTIGIWATYGPCFFSYTKIQKQRLVLCRQESLPLGSKSHAISMMEFVLSQQTSSPAAAVWGSLTLDLPVFKFQM